MKNLCFLLLLTISFGFAQDHPLFTQVLRIKYSLGPPSQKIKEMVFYMDNHQVFGRISIPNTDLLIARKIKLSASSLQTLTSFIALAQSYENDCAEIRPTSSVSTYEINLDGKTTTLKPSCDWKSLSYDALEQKIFKSGKPQQRAKN